MPGNSEATWRVRAHAEQQHVEAGHRAVVLRPGGLAQLGGVGVGRLLGRQARVGAAHHVHPRGVDVDVVEQRLAGAGLVALGVAGGQEPLVAPPDVQAPPVDGVAGRAWRRSRPAWRCRRVPPVSTRDADPRAACASTSRVISRAATALASTSPSRWTTTVGTLTAHSFMASPARPGAAVCHGGARDSGPVRLGQSLDRGLVDLVRVEPAQLLGEQLRRSAAGPAPRCRSGWPGRDSVASRPSPRSPTISPVRRCDSRTAVMPGPSDSATSHRHAEPLRQPGRQQRALGLPASASTTPPVTLPTRLVEGGGQQGAPRRQPGPGQVGVARRVAAWPGRPATRPRRRRPPGVGDAALGERAERVLGRDRRARRPATRPPPARPAAAAG